MAESESTLEKAEKRPSSKSLPAEAPAEAPADASADAPADVEPAADGPADAVAAGVPDPDATLQDVSSASDAVPSSEPATERDAAPAPSKKLKAADGDGRGAPVRAHRPPPA